MKYKMRKYITLVLVVQFCFMVSACIKHTGFGVSVISFKKLSQDEGLEYNITRKERNYVLVIRSTNRTKKEIFRKEGSYIDDLPLSYGKSTGMIKDKKNKLIKWIAVSVCYPEDNKTSRNEIWFIDTPIGSDPK